MEASIKGVLQEMEETKTNALESITQHRIKQGLDEAEAKALDSLARYKFQMFGYWCGVWVHLNRLLGPGDARPNPFKALVLQAREMKGGDHVS
jgi:hypothetical protein